MIVTREDKKKHRKKIITQHEQLQEAETEKAKAIRLFLKTTTLLGHGTIEHGIKPNNEKIKTISQSKPPTSFTKLKSFLGSKQYFAKFFTQTFRKNRPNETTGPEEIGMDLDRERRKGF